MQSLLRRCSSFTLRVLASPEAHVRPFALPISCLSPIGNTAMRGISTKTFVGGFMRQKEQPSEVLEKFSANAARIRAATTRNSDWMLQVTFEDGNISNFPYIWLRDNCQCLKCFHPTTLSRLILLKDLNINITPSSIQVLSDSKDLEIVWADGHRSCFPGSWLQGRSFSVENRKKYNDFRRPSLISWGSELQQQLPQVDFNSVFVEDETLLDFLLKLEKFGLVIMKNVPRRPGEIRRLSGLVGYLKRTHYGTDFFVDVRADPNNLAYTSKTLNLHTDLPYLESRPGVQLLHCIKQAESGGANHLVDSYHVALKLQKSHPEKFDILSSVPIDFIDIGKEDNDYHFDARSQSPVIQLDRDGEISGVSINQMVRDSHFDISVDRVRDWYDAMITFYDLLYHPENLITYKMADGEMLVMDNLRVSHGRTGFSMNSVKRQLEGSYWDWDMARSCRRVLQTKLGYY